MMLSRACKAEWRSLHREEARVLSVLLYQGDCLKIMKTLPNASVDLILCDLPYGVTACEWDSVIPLEPLWKQYRRLVKEKTAIVLTASQPFTTALISSNLWSFCYSWVWNKTLSGSFVQASRMPLRIHEDVLVFCFADTLPRYFPQMTARSKSFLKKIGNHKTSETIPIRNAENVWLKEYTEKYPVTILNFSTHAAGRGLHPTQKPVGLMEYLIKTYTNEGDTVLDNCMGSGTTGVACVNLNRNFIGIELNPKYFELAKRRIGRSQYLFDLAYQELGGERIFGGDGDRFSDCPCF